MVVNIHTAKRTGRYAHHSITEMPPRKLEEFSRAVGGTRHSPPEQLPSHVGDVCSAVDPKRPAGHGEHAAAPDCENVPAGQVTCCAHTEPAGHA